MVIDQYIISGKYRRNWSFRYDSRTGDRESAQRSIL